METIRKVRLAARDKKPIRQISRELRLSRNTVRKVLRGDETRFEYQRKAVPRPRLGAYIETLDGWLLAEQALSVKRRRTMLSLYEVLQDEGYRGGYDAVRRYVKGWRAAHNERVGDVYVPLSFDPDEAFQFDWSHETVVLGGHTTEIKVAHFRLAFSRMFLVIAYMRENSTEAESDWPGSCTKRRGRVIGSMSPSHPQDGTGIENRGRAVRLDSPGSPLSGHPRGRSS